MADEQQEQQEREREPMQITVKFLDKEPLIMVVKESDTLDDVMAKIQDMADIPTDQQRLLFDGLEPTIHCVRHLEGGMAWDSTYAIDAIKKVLKRFDVALPDMPPACGPNSRDALGVAGYMKWKQDVVRLGKDLMSTGCLDSRAFSSMKRAMQTMEPRCGDIDASTKVI